MVLRWREYGGRPGDALLANLHRSIGQYQRGSRALKIGLTTDPIRRWREQRREGWREMVVIYSTSSRNYAAAVEKNLAAHGWNNYYASWNYNPGGEPIPGSYTRYYVYVLLD